MGRRSDFPRIDKDAYDSPPEVVLPLLPHLPTGTRFAEPCAGKGALIAALQAHGHTCAYAGDIAPRAAGIAQRDALNLTAADVIGVESIITNPPWTRPSLHGLIDHLRMLRPTWLLFNSNWANTAQAAPFLRFCTKIVVVGRVKWIPGTAMTGKEDCSWFKFDDLRIADRVRRQASHGDTSHVVAAITAVAAGATAMNARHTILYADAVDAYFNMPGVSIPEARDLALRAVPLRGSVRGDTTKTALPLFARAQDAIRRGHSFELHATTEILEDICIRYDGIFGRVPYPVTPVFLAGFMAHPILFICTSDRDDGQINAVHLYDLRLEGGEFVLMLVLIVTIDGNGRPSMPLAVTEEDQDANRLFFRQASAVLNLIADDRHRVERIVAPAKLNKARAKSGKSPIPDRWRVDYVTRLSTTMAPGKARGGAQGGTHASPRPHDRRGHKRRLQSGRIVWMRPAHIGEIVRHLTRGRAFYRLDAQNKETHP